jgi:hypothetical protein
MLTLLLAMEVLTGGGGGGGRGGGREGVLTLFTR